jgi:rhodanese-related sulfurtransferase
MRTILKYAIIIALLPAMFLASCKKEADENKYQILYDYLKENAATIDLPKMHAAVGGQGWAVSATALNNSLADYYIIDLRSPADFAAGRIAGAVNTTMANVLTEAAKAGTKKIMLVCYSGQNAAYALAACRLSGYTNTFFLKWGMSAWNSTKDVWTSKIGNIAISPSTHANWTTPPSFASNVAHTSVPAVISSSDDGAEILRERIAAVLAEGAKFVTPAEALNTPSNYFINNYWTVDNVTGNGNGHIVGAYRINPLTLANDDIKFLDPKKKIVTYCWTGQTSAAVTFYLRVLGFDAYGLQWGVNGLNNSQLTSNKWPEGQQNFPLQ